LVATTAAAVLLASSCYHAEGFSIQGAGSGGSSVRIAGSHQRLMRSESAALSALRMVGSIRKQPANYPGGGSPEQIARRNQDVLAAAERGDRGGGRARNHPKRSGAAAAAAAAANDPRPDAPSALNDAYRIKSLSTYEILMPDDITLSSNQSANQLAEAPTPDQLENAEARTRKSAVDAKIAALLADDDDEDGGDIADGDLADRSTVYTRLSDTAKSQATAAISKPSSYGAAASAGGGAPASATTAAGRVVSKKKRVTAQVQETGRDTIQSYTKSFTNHELLSRESEAALGREIQILARWEVRRQELEVELMSPPTFAQWAEALTVTVPDLKRQIRKSQRAKAALVEANLRLVVTSARRAVKTSQSDLSFHDACQDGIIGLTRAAEKFDPDRDFRFSTYSLWWIKGEITKSINHQSSQIRLPRSARKKINDIRINERLLMADLGRKPTDTEVAAKCELSQKELAFYRRSAREVVSIDQSLTAHYGKGSAASGDSAKKVTQIGDLVQDSGPTPEELASKQMFKDDVRKLVMKSLTPREQVVIRLRFGLDDGEPQTLKAISAKFGVDPKKIKKLEERALSKLRERADGSSFDM